MGRLSLLLKRFFVSIMALGGSLGLSSGASAEGGPADRPLSLGAEPPSIYEAIVAATDNEGRLSPDFIWEPEAEEGALKMAPGAMDGISIYHMSSQPSAEDVAELLGLVKKACWDNSADNTEAVLKFLSEHSALSMVDGLLDQIGPDNQDLSPQGLAATATDWALKGRDLELVKLALALLGIINVENNEEIQRIITTLGRYDEFSLYAVVAMQGWPNGNQRIFDLARGLEGWGKVHALERLRPETPEIREWFITDGCRGLLAGLYSASTCATKGDLAGQLKANQISEALFDGAGDLIETLLDGEGPMDHLRVYPQANEALVSYLSQAVRHCRRPDQLHVAGLVKKYLTALDEGTELVKSRAEIANDYNRIIAGQDWPGLIEKAIGEASPTSNISCIRRAAEDLNLDISEPLFNLVQTQPLEHIFDLTALYKDKAMAEKVTAFYEEFLPPELDAIENPDQTASFEAGKRRQCLQIILEALKPYPGLGLPLVKTGLSRAYEPGRRSAVYTLEAWLSGQEEAGLADFDAELIPLVEQAYDQENDEDFKARLKSLLPG